MHSFYEYLYEKKETSLEEFVTSLYLSGLEAKQNKNEALSYVYKILLNSVYSRLGISPKGAKTEIGNQNQLLRESEFVSDDLLSDNSYIGRYYINTGSSFENWDPSKNSAIQLAAAITALGSIYTPESQGLTAST